MDASLLRALRIVERADSGALRSLLFARVAGRSPSVRLARWVTHGPLFRGTRLSALLVSGFGAATSLRFLVAPAPGKIWALALYENERRQVRHVARCVGSERLAMATVRAGLLWSRPTRAVLRHLGGRGGVRFLRTVRRFSRRHDFLVACRLASALACALVSRVALSEADGLGVLVSSDYNAEAVGLGWAARRGRLPTLFVSHSHTHALSPPLDFSLAILEGEAALEAYARKGPVKARVVFRGVEGVAHPLDPGALARPNPAIGLFLPKETAWPVFTTLVQEARRTFGAKSLVIRWHPNMLERPRLERVLADLEGVSVCERGSSLEEDARRCDFVVADENSSVHLGVLKGGVPTVAIRGLAVFPEGQNDFYGFEAHRIVPPSLPSLAELRPEEVIRFYSAGWPERFRRYDASYLLPPGALDREVGAAVAAVLGLPLSS
jgi:hypothetical protein